MKKSEPYRFNKTDIVHWDSRYLDQSRAFDFFQDVIMSGKLLPWQTESPKGRDFESRLAFLEVHDGRVGLSRSTPVLGRRTPNLVSRSEAEGFYAHLVLQGELLMQLQRAAEIAPPRSPEGDDGHKSISVHTWHKDDNVILLVADRE